jgi:OOP family OmpA-OmpF porin
MLCRADRDSDGDGVLDANDQCPDTPRGVAVDAVGCALDTDGDGVPDYRDRCPGTPSGAAVDEKGCPLDSDGDGVPDYMDRCPRTPRGATVNEVGCWVCKDVQFALNQWRIEAEYHPNLDEAVQCMQHHPEIKVEIQGHTDSTGTKAYNQVLSEKRAQAVMEYFVSKGIARERLTAVGYGLSRPIASNKTKEGRAKNRRVQLKPIY